MLILFYFSLATIVYVYFGYPLLLWLGAFGRPRSAASRVAGASCGESTGFPSISILVAAHNEEAAIVAKIENLLSSDYPRARSEILIGDDGSTDETAAIARLFASQGVKLISLAAQQGKSAVQNRLAVASSGDVLVFTDADCLIPRGALQSLVQHFSDPRVGLVTARPRFVNERETSVAANEGLYLRYETWLRARESARGILAMASGSLFAVRRSLWRPLDAALGDDFVLPMRVLQAGRLNILDPRVVAVTRLSQNRPRTMLRMKTRIISKDLRSLLANRDLLNPLRYPAVALALVSHKLLRWLVPYFLAVLATSDVFLLERRALGVFGAMFGAFAALQAAFYAAAIVGFARYGRAPGDI